MRADASAISRLGNLILILNSNNLWKTPVENDSHYQSQACGKPVEKPVENGSLSNTITRIF
jgi:hypothetical protein